MLWQLSASDAAQKIRDGLISSEELVRACLARINETDDAIKAWVHLDPDNALQQANAMDHLRQTGKPTGPLHGVPVGIKDIFDTADMPTENGTPVYADRQPDRDALVISRLKEAGAVIMGKTCTTEVAFLAPSVTANPHNPQRTPGGSSSGSAAAVAVGHVPLALGSQTNGSTIRPASFCGIYGFKPSRGLIPRKGVLQTSRSLDQVGIFARTLDDTAIVADALQGFDDTDPLSHTRPKPQMLAGAQSEPQIEPDIAWFDGLFADRLDSASKEGFDELLSALPGRVEKIPVPKTFDQAVKSHNIVHEYELLQHLGPDLEAGWQHVTDLLKDVITRARGYSQGQYEDALAMLAGTEDYFAQFFHDYDAVLSPSSTGEAPARNEGTGDPIFCTLWTFAGLPALSMPLLTGHEDLPIGVQLVGSFEGDDRLLRTAGWLHRTLEETTQEGTPS